MKWSVNIELTNIESRSHCEAFVRKWTHGVVKIFTSDLFALHTLLADLSEEPQTLHDVDEVKAEPVAALVAPVLVQLVVNEESYGKTDWTEPIEDGTDQIESILKRFE